MSAKTIKEEFVGALPLRHSVELLELEDGRFQVVGRLQPDASDGAYPPPMLSIDDYTNRAEAEFRFHTILSLMRKFGPPAKIL